MSALPQALRRRAAGIFSALGRAYPDAGCALRRASALDLLVATILSAQCTDERVNKVTKGLFRKYRKAEDYAGADLRVLEMEVHSTGFFRSKARHIRDSARMLIERHEGRVPGTMEELLELPGVARKTANVVLSAWFGKAEGVVVDTHVLRLSRRMGLSRTAAPEKVERGLMGLFERRHWGLLSHRLIRHGRQVCRALKPDCARCPVRSLCARVGLEPTSRSRAARPRR
ncbi:MAG: endonuclease III [Elusimicrobia bacterium]|nr:endonuclease III [Elusimicrobiota bacterium]